MANIYSFKITLKQQFALLRQAFFTIVVFPLGFILILHQSLNGNAFLITFSFVLLIDIFPTIILHLQYWYRNHNSTLIINADSKELTYCTSRQKLNYRFSDIEKVDYYRNLGKGSGMHSFGNYRYYKLTCLDKTEIILTCLMISNIENTIEVLLRVKSEKHTKWLCLID